MATASNGLPTQTSKVGTPPVVAERDAGLIDDISTFLNRAAQSIAPVLDIYTNYKLGSQQIKLESARNLDGTYAYGDYGYATGFSGGLSNPNNQTLLVIAGLAAAGVAIVLLAK